MRMHDLTSGMESQALAYNYVKHEVSVIPNKIKRSRAWDLF